MELGGAMTGYSASLNDDYLCPKGTMAFSIGPNYFCNCEDHCSWYKCRLNEPPLDCLDGKNSTWQWNIQKKYWVAQIRQGMNRY